MALRPGWARGWSLFFGPGDIRIAGLRVPRASDQTCLLVPPRGREITREGDGPLDTAELAAGIRSLLASPTAPLATELEQFVARLSGAGGAVPLASTRHFPDSDYTAHHRPGFRSGLGRFWWLGSPRRIFAASHEVD